MEEKTVFEVFIEGYGDNSKVVYGLVDGYEELFVIIKSFSGNYNITTRKLKVI